MKYESLSKFLVKLIERFANCFHSALILKAGHKLCLITFIQKTKNSNTP
jgi:hypothetical protein